MADYTPLLTRAITGQDEAARAGIYARAREALERQLRGFEPKLAEEQIIAELAGLNAAIETVEASAEGRPVEGQASPETAQEQEAASPTPEAAAPLVDAPPFEAEKTADPETVDAEPPETPHPIEVAPKTAWEDVAHVEGAESPAEDVLQAMLAEQAPDPVPPAADTKSASPDEAEVLKVANTDEVSAPPLVEPILPTSRPRMPLRDEVRKSRKPLVMAAGAALIVILGMGGLALSRRTSPDPLGALKSQSQDLASIEAGKAEAGKTEGRLASEQPARPVETSVATPPEATPPPGNGAASDAALNTSTRAFMVLESPGSAPSQFEGRALWSFEPDAATKGEKTLRTIIAFPGSDMTIDLSLSRNKDAGLGASHLLMAIFDTPKGFEPVREMSPIEWREREATAGSVFRGSVVPVQDNVFMVTLDKASEGTNVALIRTQKWMVFEFRLANGRRGATLIEKGASGDKAAEEALQAWK